VTDVGRFRQRSGHILEGRMCRETGYAPVTHWRAAMRLSLKIEGLKYVPAER